MKVFKKTLLTISAILLIGLYLGFRYYESQVNATALKQETLELDVPAVEVVHPKPVEQEQTITLPGNIEAWFTAPIFAQTPGYVKMWYKDYGAEVKEGDILAEINQPMLDAEYRQAKADLQAARADYKLAVVAAKRFVSLRKTQAASKQAILEKVQDMKAQKAEVKAAEQKVKTLEARMQFKTIRAPYDGIVIERNINVGDYVNEEGSLSGTEKEALFTVADISVLRLFVNVPASLGAFLQPGATADVTVLQFPNRHFTAKFLNIAKGFDKSTRTVRVQFTIDNEDRALWPNTYAKVRITAPVERDVVRVPLTALVFQENGTELAMLTEDDRIHFKPITPGRILTKTIDIPKEEVSLSDRIVNHPSAALLEGDKVRIVTPAPGYSRLNTEASASKEQYTEAPASQQSSSTTVADN